MTHRLMFDVRSHHPLIKTEPDECELAISPSDSILRIKKNEYSVNYLKEKQSNSSHLYFIKSSRRGNQPKSMGQSASKVLNPTESSHLKLKPNFSSMRRELEVRFKSTDSPPKYTIKNISRANSTVRRESPSKLQSSVDKSERISTTSSPQNEDKMRKKSSTLPEIQLEDDMLPCQAILTKRTPSKSIYLDPISRSIEYKIKRESTSRSNLYNSTILSFSKNPLVTKRTTYPNLPSLQDSKMMDRMALQDSPGKFIHVRKSISNKVLS